MSNRKNILIAPLNWGLGHATRCIPIIRKLQKKNVHIFIASDGDALTLLKLEFPNLTFLPIRSYSIKYYQHLSFATSIAIQLPRIIRACLTEYKQIQQIVKKYHIQAILSDNRFGCYHKHIHSIFITHQVNIQTASVLKSLADKLNHSYIQKFDSCWIPDLPAPESITTALSLSDKINTQKYIGFLSRFTLPFVAKKQYTYDLLVVLSGPEPARSIFEKKIVTQIAQTKLRTLIIRGKKNPTHSLSHISKHVQVISLANSQQLNTALVDSKYVLCRSGYSSVMDLLSINRNAIIVPTHGQTEQEYIANILKEKKWFYSCLEKEFDLLDAINQSRMYKLPTTFDCTSKSDHLLDTAIDDLLNKI